MNQINYIQISYLWSTYLYFSSENGKAKQLFTNKSSFNKLIEKGYSKLINVDGF